MGLGRACLCILLYVGCSGSDDDLRVPDADGTHDAVPDSELIRVKVYSHDEPGLPLKGARVVFRAPNGSETNLVTNEQGLAAFSSPPGTTVTAIQDSTRHSPGRFFSNYKDLGPGDLVFSGPRTVSGNAIGSFIVEFPQFAGGERYELSCSCSCDGTLVDSNVPNITHVTIRGPCLNDTSATLVGRVRDVDGELLGVSVAEGVDLPEQFGSTLSMPPFSTAAQPIRLSATNVTALSVVWTVAYAQDTSEILERQTVPASKSGTFEIFASGYPVGNRSLFSFVQLTEVNGAVRVYRSSEPGRLLDFSFDGLTAIKSVSRRGEIDSENYEIEWDNLTGSDPEVAIAVVESSTMRGVIYSRYSGPSMSVDDLPSDIKAHISRFEVSEIKHVGGLGNTYSNSISSFEETVGLTVPLVTTPNDDSSYWLSTFPADYPAP